MTVIKNYITYIAGALIVLALVASFIGGYRVHEVLKPCPEVSTDTVYIYDTTWKYIYQDKYHIKHDTVTFTDTVPAYVDTAAILKDYYASHIYQREWQDSTIIITLQDSISQNFPWSTGIKYRLLQPQQVINNVTINHNYSRYLYGGISGNSVDLSSVSLDLTYAAPGFYVGAGYMPYVKGVSMRAGVTLIKLR